MSRFAWLMLVQGGESRRRCAPQWHTTFHTVAGTFEFRAADSRSFEGPRALLGVGVDTRWKLTRAVPRPGACRYLESYSGQHCRSQTAATVLHTVLPRRFHCVSGVFSTSRDISFPSDPSPTVQTIKNQTDTVDDQDQYRIASVDGNRCSLKQVHYQVNFQRDPGD